MSVTEMAMDITPAELREAILSWKQANDLDQTPTKEIPDEEYADRATKTLVTWIVERRAS